MNSHPIEHWHQAEAHFRDQQWPRAHTLFTQLAKLPQWAGPAQLRLAQIASAQGKLREATLHILTAAASGEDDVMVLEAVATTLCQLGELEAFVQLLATPALSRTSDATVALTLGRLASQQALTEHALPLLRHALQLGLDQPELHYLIGLNLLYRGELDEAGRHFEACLARAPLHAACHRQLARLTKARAGHHHVDRLRRTLSALGAEHVDAPPLHYALFKQLDDLDDTPAAWASLSFGMRLRRGQIHHDMEAERRSFAQLMRMPAPIPEKHPQPSTEAVPIFIVGQPRSGTTLLDRMLVAGGDVTGAGELRDFPFQTRWTCDQDGAAAMDEGLAERLAGGDVDWQLLGQRYLDHSRWLAAGCHHYTDKLPSNFLFVGAIARALPQARIVHLHRSAPDVCFSNLKELFADAYPHSYDQGEMAAHYRHYHKLMRHWHTCLPGRILDVAYEDLVSQPERINEQLREFCGLDARPLDRSELARGTIATASSVQLRDSVDSRFVGGWRRYAQWLDPLLQALGEDADAR